MSAPVYAFISKDLAGAAEATGLGLSTIKRAVSRGDLPVHYEGRKPLVMAQDLHHWVESKPGDPA